MIRLKIFLVLLLLFFSLTGIQCNSWTWQTVTESKSEKVMTLQRVSIIAVVLFCQQAFVESVVEECSGEAEYPISGLMLRRHIYKKITGAPNDNLCLRECYRDVRCQSFNYVISKGTCELNNRTKEARPENFVPNYDRYYFKRDKGRGNECDGIIKFVVSGYIYLDCFYSCSYDIIPWLSYEYCVARISLRKST